MNLDTLICQQIKKTYSIPLLVKMYSRFFTRDLFQPDNVRDQVSVNKLRDLGGISAIETIFNSDIVKGLNIDDVSDISRRK